MARTIESEFPDYDDVELSIPPFVCQPWHNDACPKYVWNGGGDLEGCTGVSITAFDKDGKKFQGTPDNYHETEAAAWASAKKGLSGSIEALKVSISESQQQVASLEKFLFALGESK